MRFVQLCVLIVLCAVSVSTLVLYSRAHIRTDICQSTPSARRAQLEQLSHSELVDWLDELLTDKCAPKPVRPRIETHARIRGRPEIRPSLPLAPFDERISTTNSSVLKVSSTSLGRRLLETGADVDNATFAVLQDFAQLCSASAGCTCFNGSAVLRRPVCGSGWGLCDAQGQLLALCVSLYWAVNAGVSFQACVRTAV
jgi:hypothetical protein